MDQVGVVLIFIFVWIWLAYIHLRKAAGNVCYRCIHCKAAPFILCQECEKQATLKHDNTHVFVALLSMVSAETLSLPIYELLPSVNPPGM